MGTVVLFFFFIWNKKHNLCVCEWLFTQFTGKAEINTDYISQSRKNGSDMPYTLTAEPIYSVFIAGGRPNLLLFK